MLSEMSESMRQTINDLTYMANLKTNQQMNKQKKKKGRLSYREQTGGCLMAELG